MKFIINTTNLQSGGALQVALSLLEEWQLIGIENDFHVLLSPQLEQFIDQNTFAKNFRFYSFEKNPTSTIFSHFTFYKKLKRLEANIKPDAVFSIFGPALWTPQNPHLVGFANGYYLFEDSVFIKKRILSNVLKRIKYFGRRYLLFHQLKKEAEYYWVETILAKEKLSKTTGISADKISVIGNTYGRNFKNIKAEFVKNKTFTLLYLSAFYEHKNFEIISKIIPILKERNIEYSFLLTLPKFKFDEIFSQNKNSDYLKNIGPIHPQETYKLYAQADAVFMPSLLETFSANYPEAMQMELPIVCSDFEFSRNICADAAIYFDAENPEDCANKIVALIENENLQKQLVEAGKKRLEHLETPESRAEKLLKLLKEIAQTKNSNK